MPKQRVTPRARWQCRRSPRATKPPRPSRNARPRRMVAAGAPVARPERGNSSPRQFDTRHHVGPRRDTGRQGDDCLPRVETVASHDHIIGLFAHRDNNAGGQPTHRRPFSFQSSSDTLWQYSSVRQRAMSRDRLILIASILLLVFAAAVILGGW